MDFGDFIRSVEHNESANEQTKRELLDIVMTKAGEAFNALPYPKMARKFSDDRSRSVCLTDWSPSGRYYDPPAIAEIVFFEKDSDGFSRRTSYEFLEGPDGLGLAKYVETEPLPDEQTVEAERAAMESARDEETKQAEKSAMELLSEAMEKENGLDNLMAFLDAMPEEQKQRMNEEEAREEKEWNDARAFADELGTSFVSESEALALLDMINTVNWDENSDQQ